MALPVRRDYTGFNDEDDMAGYAREAIEKFFRAGIINGKQDNNFDPRGNATRAELALMLMNFLESDNKA